jgi:predicted Fe-S protein YdhL (DUF1289 family)
VKDKKNVCIGCGKKFKRISVWQQYCNECYEKHNLEKKELEKKEKEIE